MMIRRLAFNRALAAGLLALGLGGCTISIPLRGDLVANAERYEGRTGPSLGLSQSLWCAEFTDLVRKESGFTPVGSRRAIDQARKGRRIGHPVRGALMITRRGRAGNHVDIVVRVIDQTTVEVIGGNVNARVARRTVPTAGAIFILPT